MATKKILSLFITGVYLRLLFKPASEEPPSARITFSLSIKHGSYSKLSRREPK